MGPCPIVLSSPGFHLFLGILQGQEPVPIRALLTEASVELPDEGAVRGFPARLKFYSTPMSTTEINEMGWVSRVAVGNGNGR